MSIWQTKSWQKMLEKSGQVSEFFEVGNLFIEKRSLGFQEYGLFILGFEGKINKSLEKKLIDLCKKEKCLFIQIETLNYENNSKLKTKIFNLGTYKKFITPYTSLIDLSKSEDEILSLMKPKGRYNIKLARKKGVQIIEVEKTDKNIKVYYDLMLETTSRDKFNSNNFNYYKIFLKSIKSSKLLFAYLDEKVIAGGIFTFSSDSSIYYYGVSTSDKKYRNLMAPYLLQWEAIKMAKQKGNKIYDFLGVASPDEKNNSLSGVTNFKLKLSSDVRFVSESYIWINKKLKYNLIIFLRYFKNLIKK